MPLYFLDVCNRDIDARDSEGQEFPDLEAARRKAIDGIRSILAHEVIAGTLDLCGEIRIRDERGEQVLAIPYAEAVDVRT